MRDLDVLVRETIEDDVKTNSAKPFPHISAQHRVPGHGWINLGRVMAIAGIAGLFWISSLVQGPHPLGLVIEKAAPTSTEIRIVMEKSADFVKIALFRKTEF